MICSSDDDAKWDFFKSDTDTIATGSQTGCGLSNLAACQARVCGFAVVRCRRRAGINRPVCLDTSPSFMGRSRAPDARG